VLQLKSHVHLNFDMLHSDGKELEGLQLLNKLYDWLHSHGWLDQWRVLNVELVASCTGGTPHASVAGQTDADHQDRHTGSLAYKRVRILLQLNLTAKSIQNLQIT
jgi:hypothetical protein